MPKYYVQNGETKIVVQTDTEKEAAYSVLHRIIKDKPSNVSLLTMVSEAGFIEDLIEFKMSDAMDKGNGPYLTSTLLSEMAESFYDLAGDVECEDEDEEDNLFEKHIKDGDICTELMDALNLQEEEIIQTDTPEANLILEISSLEA
jgi:hypothetical protein